MTLPMIKKKISSFLIGEEGQISKKSLIGLGIVLSGVAIKTASATCACPSDCPAVCNPEACPCPSDCASVCNPEACGACDCACDCNCGMCDCSCSYCSCDCGSCSGECGGPCWTDCTCLD